ncbi:hypothetical protein Taro_036819 [Colocasia esculenta]|uniref:Secreted protein n=1 Tax=Colocasia esculenta TaxID=4460 RepID=A0A843WAX8_COLES|nr:hypothetical protein [Colocasia esculenta]
MPHFPLSPFPSSSSSFFLSRALSCSLTVLGVRGARGEEVSSPSCRGCARGAWSEEEVRLLSSGRGHVGQRRRGDSRRPRS